MEYAWQPIETVPKDGKDILLFFPDAIEPIMICFWAEWDDPENSAGWQERITSCPQPIYDVEPTHWMELPLPPKVIP